MYLISAYFDEKTTKTLQKYIELIAERSGNTFMTEHHVPPHMTISSVEARNTEVLLPYMADLEKILWADDLQFVSVGAFFPYVLYITPVLNRYLQKLSEKVHAAVEEISEVKENKFYCPYQWFPHVTLGKTLTKEQMRVAFQVMQESFVPFEGRIVSVGLAKVNPHVDVWKVRFI